MAKPKYLLPTLCKVHQSTIGREIDRNSTKRGSYNPAFAHELSEERKERFSSKRAFTKSIQKYVDNKIIKEQWSPKQIVGYCRENNMEMVSCERIYQYIREDKKQVGTLYKHLRHQLKHRKRPVSGKKITIKDLLTKEAR